MNFKSHAGFGGDEIFEATPGWKKVPALCKRRPYPSCPWFFTAPPTARALQRRVRIHEANTAFRPPSLYLIRHAGVTRRRARFRRDRRMPSHAGVIQGIGLQQRIGRQ